MPPHEACSFAGAVTDAAGVAIGEARMWGAGERGPEGTWTAWLRSNDLGGIPPPGRYRVEAFAGWSAEFDIRPSRPSRVFETELVVVAGVGPVPWPPDGGSARSRSGRPPLVATPWQSSRGIPPFKQEGDGAPRAWPGRSTNPPAPA